MKKSRYQKLIHKLKYHGHYEIGFELGRLFGYDLKKSEWIKDVDFIVPVPLHPKRQKKRGYNQSELLSKQIAKAFCLRHFCPLSWIQYGGQQAGKSRKERIKSRAFTMEIKKGFKDKIFGKDFLLVDDVAATMSTVNECSRVLRENGSKSVGVIVISRN